MARAGWYDPNPNAPNPTAAQRAPGPVRGARGGIALPANAPHPNPSPIAMGEGLATPKSGAKREYLPLLACAQGVGLSLP